MYKEGVPKLMLPRRKVEDITRIQNCIGTHGHKRHFNALKTTGFSLFFHKKPQIGVTLEYCNFNKRHFNMLIFALKITYNNNVVHNGCI